MTPWTPSRGRTISSFRSRLGVALEVYAPHAEQPITADAQLLGALAPGARVILGCATPMFREAAERAGITIHEYNEDRELMLLRAPAIVEGAIQVAIENTDITINDASIVVVRLRQHRDHCWRAVCSRWERACTLRRGTRFSGRPPDADGAISHSLEELPSLAPTLQMVFSTVPARVVGREILEALPAGSLVLDIAPPPDHADLELAAELGHRAVWARGLGRRAPVTRRREPVDGHSPLHRGDRKRSAPRRRADGGRRSGGRDERGLAVSRRRDRRRGLDRTGSGARAGEARPQAHRSSNALVTC